jgi:hypothetical protein
MSVRSHLFGLGLDIDTALMKRYSLPVRDDLQPQIANYHPFVRVSSQVTALSGRSINQSSGWINRLGYRVTA